MAVGSGAPSVFSSPVEQHTAELVNERLDSWELTIRTVIDYFSGTQWPICTGSEPIFRGGKM